jgi:hypothetical protein
MEIDLEALEIELKKRVEEYPRTRWPRKQNDSDDEATKFIYKIRKQQLPAAI